RPRGRDFMRPPDSGEKVGGFTDLISRHRDDAVPFSRHRQEVGRGGGVSGGAATQTGGAGTDGAALRHVLSRVSVSTSGGSHGSLDGLPESRGASQPHPGRAIFRPWQQEWSAGAAVGAPISWHRRRARWCVEQVRRPGAAAAAQETASRKPRIATETRRRVSTRRPRIPDRTIRPGGGVKTGARKLTRRWAYTTGIQCKSSSTA
ncbi:MAG: hypothetical protein QOD06_3232, partial [Candidatus Binatota bacterium]|nr:hypothetical protein [Candidatus Binatota bacterium]